MPGSATQTPPREAFDLRESISLSSLAEAAGSDSLFREDGTVPIHIIRPGIGKGKGNHLYEAQMLQENAHKFAGWKMYVDHESEQARKAAGGLPRKMRDLGGRIVESKWDPTVPADPARGFGQGAVVGYARPVKWIRELIEDDPELAEASISASATGVRPVVRDGQRVWLVEGIEDRGSVDWVTEAGAGGRVAALMEAAYADEGDEAPLLESMTDEDFLAVANRRGLRLSEADSTPMPKKCPNCGHKVKLGKHKDCPECGASMKKLAEADSTPEGDDMADITPKALEEALASDPALLVTALAKSAESQVFISSLVEAKMEEERESIKAEVKAEADRRVQLTEMAASAKEQISESKLPPSWQASLVEKFSLVEGAPTADLDITPDVDDSGEVTKTAEEKLREAVEAEIKRERERLAEASPTRVRGQGGKAADGELEEGADPEKKAGEPEDKPEWAQFLQEAGVDPDSAYAA